MFLIIAEVHEKFSSPWCHFPDTFSHLNNYKASWFHFSRLDFFPSQKVLRPQQEWKRQTSDFSSLSRCSSWELFFMSRVVWQTRCVPGEFFFLSKANFKQPLYLLMDELDSHLFVLFCKVQWGTFTLKENECITLAASHGSGGLCQWNVFISLHM